MGGRNSIAGSDDKGTGPEKEGVIREKRTPGSEMKRDGRQNTRDSLLHKRKKGGGER